MAPPPSYGEHHGIQTGASHDFSEALLASQEVSSMRREKPATPQIHKPWFCYFVLFSNTSILLYAFYLSDWKIDDLHLNPMVGPSDDSLTKLGAKVTVKIQEGEWWRLFTAMFLHAGVVHLLVNMVAVIAVGISLEEDFGSLRIASLYLISGVTGNLLSANFLPLQMTVGASGSCFGLLGAALGDLLQNSHRVEEWCRQVIYLLSCACVSLMLGLLPLIDNFAHVGGFMAGTLAGLSLLVEETTVTRGGDSVSRCCLACRSFVAANAGILLGALIMLLSVLLVTATDPRGWCSFCESINCVETPLWDCDSASLVKCSGTLYGNGTADITCIDGATCNTQGTTLTKAMCLDCCA